MYSKKEYPSWAEVAEITGEHLAESWFQADELFLYEKDGSGYGLIGLYSGSGETYVASTMKEADVIFPIAMLKDLLKISYSRPMTMITDVKAFHEKIQQGLCQHGFKFAIMGDIMYSRNNHKGRNDDVA